MIESLIAGSFLLPATAAAFYYFGLVVLARFTPRIIPQPTPTTRFTILVPAHNEELSLPATLQSIQHCDYPSDLISITVIADNCDDATAEVARSYACHVIERHDAMRRGKGYALEFALKSILQSKPDTVLFLDADAELAADALRIFDARFAAGIAVVQGSVRTRNPGDGASSLVAAVGNVLDDAVAASRDQLGWHVPLRGSNMAFRRDVLERLPWTCHGLTEDAEYSAKLHDAGVRIHFEPGAIARSESPARLDALCQQRRRWRAAFQSGGPQAWLDSKPAVLAHLLLTTFVTGVAAMMLAKPLSLVLFGWLATIWMMTFAVYGSSLAATRGSAKSLMGIPRVVLRLLAVTVGRGETQWRRTRRVAEG